ncbi:ATP-binding cassette domain-containing protein, partial [Staphylococcus haemolyticus]|uniref:ATP-binding cassette domain-containing protein n=1 Tax=Staphylococcus haemolyticus TaxID=1283 RepID=UPI0011A48D97
RQWSSTDEAEVHKALEMTGSMGLAERTLDSLSGGQRQRVWISMVLAQNTDTLSLDEPTTYLDLATSVEILELV